MDIDFAQRRISFRDPTRFDPPSGAKAVAVTKAGEAFAIEASVEGRPASLVLDIGNAGALALNPEFWNRPDFVGNRRISTTESGGLGGMHIYKLAHTESVDVAGTTFSDVPTVLWDGQKEEAGPAGNIGLQILRRFRLVVDLPHSRVLFVPPIDTKTPFQTNHTGATLDPGPNGQTALYVAPDSPAAAAGLKAGDVIVTIDGMNISDWAAHTGLSDWIYGAPGRKIRIGLLGGGSRTLTFGEYF